MLTWVEISQKAIEHNLTVFKRLIAHDTLLMPVIKSNAYGHGLIEVGTLLSESKLVDRICVVNLEEAIVLLKAKVKKPLIILGIYEHDTEKIKTAIKAGVVFPLYTIEQAKMLQKVGESIRKKVLVHVKLDTGTSRIGVMPNDAVAFVKKVTTFSHIAIEGLWSHFSSSENDGLVTKKQLQILTDVNSKLISLKINVPLKHMACSASTILYPQTICNAVRFGISTYGLHPDVSTNKKITLQPALTWKTTIIQVKTVPRGSKISYGGSYITKRETTLAVLPVGYWDGYTRSFSNRAEVLIKGVRCTVRGRVCMNLTMVDVTDVPGKIKAGDIVTLIGNDRKENISAEELAVHAGTINYEIVTRINPLIPRTIV